MSDTKAELSRLLKENFFVNYAEPYNPTQQDDFLDHLERRSEKFSKLYSRWLKSLLPSGSAILEIGFGTGCSSLVLAELGYVVDGIETSAKCLEIAAKRLEIGGKKFNKVVQGNFPESLGRFAIDQYDAVVFWASFEHLTIGERIDGLKSIWPKLKKSAKVFILECPNRIWHSDTHTGGSEFYHWIPDELVVRERLNGYSNQLEVYRGGRAAGFHELRAAGIPIGPNAKIQSLQSWNRRRNMLKALKWSLNSDGRYERIVCARAPHIHRALFHEYLDVCLQKPN